MAVVGEPLAAAADTRSTGTQERPREGHAPMVGHAPPALSAKTPRAAVGLCLWSGVNWRAHGSGSAGLKQQTQMPVMAISDRGKLGDDFPSSPLRGAGRPVSSSWKVKQTFADTKGLVQVPLSPLNVSWIPSALLGLLKPMSKEEGHTQVTFRW